MAGGNVAMASLLGSKPWGCRVGSTGDGPGGETQQFTMDYWATKVLHKHVAYIRLFNHGGILLAMMRVCLKTKHYKEHSQE